MRMWLTDGAFIKLHQHGHQRVGPGDKFAPDAATQFFPGLGFIDKKSVHAALPRYSVNCLQVKPLDKSESPAMKLYYAIK
jgi:hypothetical protein